MQVHPATVRKLFAGVLALVVFAAGVSLAAAQAPAPTVSARHGMVAAEEARAAEIGVEILKQGGNAVDAAVAVGFALAVTLPESGNLGGGGFMLVHLGASGKTIAIDYRETAPAAATRDMFLDPMTGKPDPKRSRDSGLAVGIPGTARAVSRSRS
jgi:gamma-glutamyltranspeptidase/glutathione hydrolase